jgi:hypothetical protein
MMATYTWTATRSGPRSRTPGLKPRSPYDLASGASICIPTTNVSQSRPAPDAQSAVKQEQVVFVFNFFDELRRLAPAPAR